jgi:hypothetical protein
MGCDARRLDVMRASGYRRHMGRRVRLALLVGVLCSAAAASAESTSAARVICPLRPTGAPAAWAFSAHIAPTSIHGRGSYTPAASGGTVCQQRANADLVLSVQGQAQLARGVVVGRVTGAQLKLHVRVSASDLPSCRVRTRGTLTLFSSYNGAHRDSVRLALPACLTETLHGSNVHVSIP